MSRGKHLFALVAVVAVLVGLVAAGYVVSRRRSKGVTPGEPDRVTSKAQPGNASVVGRGVTADSINVGVTVIDGKALQKVGVTFAIGDQRKVWTALVDDLNKKGGVLGRKLTLTFADYNLLDAASAEAACVALTQDTKTFAVLAGFLGPAMTVNKCITDNDTALLADSPDLAIAKKVPWFSPAASADRRMTLLTNLLVKTKSLQGKKFAVVGTENKKPEIQSNVIDPLKKAGLTPAVELYANTPDGDVPALNALWDAWTERIRTAGVDYLVMIDAASGSITGLLQRGYKGEVASDYSDVIKNLGSGAGSLPKERYAGVKTLDDGLTDQWTTPKIKACAKVFEAAHPELGKIKASKDVKKGDDNWAESIQLDCAQLDLFRVVLEKAGAPTNEAMLKAITTKMAKFSFGAYQFASFGPDKFDANDSFRFAEFDPTIGESGGLKPIGELLDLGSK